MDEVYRFSDRVDVFRNGELVASVPPSETTPAQLIGYMLAAHGSPDLTLAPESDPAVVNGLLGKLLVEYWWPDPEAPAGTWPTPYAAAYGIQAG